MIEPLKSIKGIFQRAALAIGALVAFPAAAFAADFNAAAQTAMSSIGLGTLEFGAPWVLLGAAALPLLWWLMRSVPPKPQKESFPAIRFLFNLEAKDQSPVRMPWWQRQIRLLAVALLITGLAQPHLNPDEVLDGDGPIMLVVDNGWASAENWDARTAEMNKVIDRAETDGRPVILLSTAQSADGTQIQYSGPVDAAEARRLSDELEPGPWPADRQAALEAIEKLDAEGDGMSVVWLSNGLDDEGAVDLAEHLRKLGKLRVIEDKGHNASQLLAPAAPAEGTGNAIAVTIHRADGENAEIINLTASDENGKPLHHVEAAFKAGETQTEAVFDVPAELRNELARISIDGKNSAGAVLLLDERWRPRPVGLLDTGLRHSSQPLLNESYFIERALAPDSSLKHGDVNALLAEQLAVMIMTDSDIIDEATNRRINEWIRNGGTLLRFAGPRLAENAGAGDDLLPVELRKGEHVLPGDERGRLAPFGEDSPFHGIALPDGAGIGIAREIMVQPGLNPDEKTWARLDDGTPLVTAQQRGKGWVVLIHTTADTDWSNLVLSGVFADMMRVIVAHSTGVTGGLDGKDNALPPFMTLNAQGLLASPPPAAQNLTYAAIEAGNVGPDNPPGFYGSETLRKAHNLSASVSGLDTLPALPDEVSRQSYAEAGSKNDLAGPLLAGGLSLLLIDLLIILGQQGYLPRVKLPRIGRGAGKEENPENKPAPAG